MSTVCLHFALDHKHQETLYCSGDPGHHGEHYFTDPQGENVCYWSEGGAIRWVNR